MKGFLIWAAGIGLTVAIIMLGLYGLRTFNQAAMPVTVVRPEPGIVCVIASATDGVAISCLRDEK